MLKQYITRFSRKSILHLKKPGHPSETIVTHPLTKYNSLFLIFIVFFTKEYGSEKSKKIPEEIMRPLRRPAPSFPSYFLSLLFFHYYKGIFS